MLGYGHAPAPSESWSLAEETEHLRRTLAAFPDQPVHLVAHSLGTVFALHLLRALGPRVRHLTLVDPVVVSVLRDTGETDGYAEMEGQYQRFISQLPDSGAAARGFVEHWSGPGAWVKIGDKARKIITALVPKIRLEMTAARSDTAKLSDLIAWKPEATILVGERTSSAPRAVARQLAKALGGSPSVVVPNAGHMILLTHPAAVVEAIEEAERRDAISALRTNPSPTAIHQAVGY
jgi:pimeloyl-ACP methyl ester carboxylesterase